MDSSVSLKTIIFWLGCFVFIRSTAVASLFSAEASSPFFFFTFRNQAFACQLGKPPCLARSIIALASYLLNRAEIVFIFMLYSSYIFCSFFVRFTCTGRIIGLAKRPSMTASLIRYLLAGGKIVMIIWFLGSDSAIVAVKPRRALLQVSSVFRISKILLNDRAVALARCTSSKIIISALFTRLRLAMALWYVLIVIS